MTTELLDPGTRVRWTATHGGRRESWPEGVWIHAGETYEGTIVNVWPALPGFRDADGEWIPPSREWYEVQLDNGADYALNIEAVTPA